MSLLLLLLLLGHIKYYIYVLSYDCVIDYHYDGVVVVNRGQMT